MDQFAKLVAGRLKAQSVPGPHPAPELLSAFAENALPEADRGQLLQHLGSCSDCREILFLALPDSPDMQKILVLKPRRFRRWGLTLGTAAAVLAVGTVVLSRNHLERSNLSAKMIATAAPATETKIAVETTPPDLGQMQAARDMIATKKAAVVAENDIKPQPEAKHMTGKMQAPLVFDQSGEVHVQTPAQSANAAAQLSKPTANLEAAAGQQTADQAYSLSPKSSPLGAVARNAPSPAALTPGPAATSSLGGVIVDPSGAVVGNAKVTTIGPAGAKTATSDSEGRFSFDSLTPGFYSIKAEASGFKATEISQVAVPDNKPSDIRVTLDVGASADVVEVTGAAAEIESPSGLVAGRQTAGLTLQKAWQTGAGAGADAKITTLQWTLSPKGTVQRSNDSGRTWQPVSVANTAGFRALSAVGANVWVGGKAGALYHSPDSGQTWVKVEPAAGARKLEQDIVGVDFSDALEGSVNTANGEVWTTSDGGRTWQRK